ncbi:MAG: rod-binding protein [Nitrospira sp.]
MFNESFGSHSVASSPLYVDPRVTLPSGQLDPQANPQKVQNPAEARRQLVKAGHQFEAYFISYLLKVMRETVPEGTISNKQGAYFHSFYDEEIGKRAAEAGGIGIAKMVQEYTDKYFSSAPMGHSSFSG